MDEIDVCLRNAGKHGLADRMAQHTPGAGSISFVRQQQARGLGHAVWTARQIVGDEPFAVLLPDMLMADDEPCLKSMMDLYDRHGGNIVAVERCAPEETHKFGIVSLKPTGDGPLVTGLVEKPAPGTAPSNLFISGRYILQPEVLDLLENQSPGAGGEISAYRCHDRSYGQADDQAVRVLRSHLRLRLACWLRECQLAHGNCPRRPRRLRQHGDRNPRRGTARGRLSNASEADRLRRITGSASGLCICFACLFLTTNARFRENRIGQEPSPRVDLRWAFPLQEGHLVE